MSDFAKKKEESDKRIREALEARKKWKETDNNSLAPKRKASDSRIEVALAERSKRVQSALPSVMSDIENLLTVEIDHYNSTKPSYGTYDTTYENQRERRTSISKLRSKVSAYRNYMDASVADNMLSMLDQMERGYDSYLALSKYESEDAYKQAVEQAEASEKARAEMLNFDLEAGQKEIDELEYILDEYDRLMVQQSSLGPDSTDPNSEANVRLRELQSKYGSTKDLDDLISEKKGYLKKAKLTQMSAKLADVANEADFGTYNGYVSTKLDGLWDKMTSQYSMGYDDLKYEYINGAENGMRSEIVGASSAWRSNSAEKWKIYNHMNQNEIAIYNYHYAKNGKEAAEKYLDSINSTLEARSNSALVQGATEFASEHEILATVFSVACTLASGAEYLSDVANYGAEIINGNEYAGMGYNESSLVGSTYRGTVTDQVDWEIGNWDAFDFLYNTTMSGADSIVAGAVFGKLGGVVLGLSAAAQATNDALNRGMSSGQAFWSGLFSGVFEGIFETVSIGQFNALKEVAPDSLKAIFKNLGKSMLVNASEETLTEIANIGYDTLVNGEFANYTLEELKDGAWKDALWQVLESGVSGALIGTGMSAIASTAGYVNQQSQYYQTGKTIKGVDGGVEALKNLANDVAGVTSTDMKETLVKQLGNVDKKATATRVGKLYNAVQMANNQANASANQADIAKSLVRKGFNAETANDIAEALVARNNGQELTRSQSKLLNSVKDSKVVQDAISNIMDNTKSTMGQRSQNIRDFQGNIARGLVTKQITDQITETIRQNTTSEQFAPAGEYEVADNGKAVNNETGEEIDIKGVASVRKGALLLDIGDGKTVNATSVSFASNHDALIYEAIANLGDNISAEAANKLIAKYDGSDAAVFARGIAQAYTYGFYGIDSSELAGKYSLATELTTEQKNFAYGLGEQYRSVKDQADKAKARAMKAPGEKGVYYRDKDGNATDIRSYLEKDKRVLNEMQATGIEFMEKMSKMMGVRFNVFEIWEENGTRYYLDENGEKTKGNPNGFYDPKTGEIYIDLFAGNDFQGTGNDLQGTILFTVAHELTHFMRQWSPEHFTKISKLVFSHAGFKGSVSSLVADKRNGKRKLDYDTALEEVVADGMETILKDGKVAEFMADVKKTDSKVWAKLKEWFKNFAEFLKKMVDAYSGQSAQTVEGQMVADFSKKLLNQIEQIWAEGAVSAGENYQTALDNVVEENAEAVSPDEIITYGAVVTDGEGTKFSIKSMKHDIAEGQMFEDLKTYCGWTQQQVNELRQNLEDLVEYMTPHRGILDMNETYGMEGRRFSPYKPNSDPLYKISMDFSTLCSKRLLTQYVIENLQLRENRPLSAEEQMAIRDMLNEYRKVEKGLQVACAMCYVEAARLKSPKQVQRWLNDPAPLLRDYFSKKNKEFNDSVKEAQADFKESRGYARNAPKKDMKNADRKELDEISHKLRSKYQPSAEEHAIIDKAKTLPNSTYLTAGNLSDLSETDPVIYDAYTAFVRSATRSKSLETDEPYYYGDSRRDNGNGIIVSDSFIEAVNRENGMRFSSWSDWRIQHLLDYITAVIDNSVRGAAMHGYTKFGEEVRVLGKTGMMFNMSGVAGTQTGLNEDGSLNFSPTESIDVNEAIQLRDEFPEIAGLQCIGVSDAHITALLRSGIIDYVIPYHVSGLNAALRRMADIYGWDNYTDTQHAVIDKSIKKENAADPEHWHEEPIFSEFFVGYNTGMSGIEAMRASAERYKQMCKDRGLTPKFNQFANEDNYWKLLIDRKMINQQTGNLIRQKAVTPTFDFNTIKEVVDRYVDNYDSGLEARALNHIVENWDSIPKRIKDLKKQGGTKAKKTKKAVGTLANQTLAAQPTSKLSDRDTAPTFYSQMAKVVDGVKQEKLGAASVVSMLRGKGVKAEEIKWSGIEAWLDGKKSVTKAELQEFIAGSMLQIEEETLSNEEIPYTEDQKRRIDEFTAKRDEVAKRLADEWKKTTGDEFPIRNVGAGLESAVANAIIDANLAQKKATFEGRLLEKLRKDLKEVIDRNDGFGFDSWKDALRSIYRHRRDFISHYDMSTNDKAIIVKFCNALNAYNELPNKISDADTDKLRDIAKEADVFSRKISDVKSEHHAENAKHMPNWGQYKLKGGENYRELLFKIPGSYYTNDAMDAHWGERRGVLAHARIQDLNTFLGKMLFIEEIQSDWHNEGHKTGYKDVPDAPFRDNYHEYVLKRLLRMAAEQGYDSIGWTTAQTQVERWSEEFAEGYRIEYDQDIPKFLNKYGKKWGTKVGKTTLDNGTEVWSMAITDSMQESVLTDGQPLYSERDTESVSNRSLLANAFEGIANPEELPKIQEYKDKVALINAEEKKLRELNEQIKELSFAKGPRDNKRIKALRFDAVQAANRINTYDKQLLRLEASEPLQKVLNREKKLAYKKAEQRGKEALAEYKAKVEAQQKETAEKWRESRKTAVAKARETAEKRDARDKLQKLVLDTVQWISYPAKTDVKCPDILKKPYEAFLKGIDLSSKRLANGGEATTNDLRLANAMDSLATAIDRVMLSQDPSQDVDKVLDIGYLDLPADFVQKLRDMTESIKSMMVDGEYVVNNMTAAEVRQLSQMIRTLNHAIKTMSKLYANLRFANVEALGFDTIGFLDALGEIEKTGGMKDFTQWDNALPYYAFKRFGKGGESIFEGLMDAQDKLAFLAQVIFDFQEKTWTGKEAKAWSEDTHTIDLPSGNKLTLTTADAMSIYCLSRREHALPHLIGGGVRVMGIEKGSKKAKDSRSLLTIQDVDSIISSLTDRQKQVAEGIQEFMSTVCSEWGNEISMKRFLTREFNEKFYFPIESNDENLPTKDPAAQQSDLFRLLNISATKPLTQGANNEVIIRNIFDVFTGHASDMARLNAYGMGLLDYMKWLNYRERGVNEEGQINVKGVRKSMEKSYGKAANSYVLNLIKDVNGRASDGGDPTILMKWMRSAKTASVGSSIRVATLQITSYPRAALVLSPQSLALGLTKIPNIKRAKKYCGIALWKSFGFYDTNISRSIEDQMKGVKDIKQKLIELSLKGAEWGDAITWGCLWNACEYEVAKTTTNKVGSEEFYQEVGKKLREVVYRTQVVDSTLTRSQIMRSKRGMAQEAAAFMSEPTLSANILMDAGFEFGLEKRRTGSAKTAWQKTGSYIGRAIAVYFIGQLTAALLEGLWDAWRDDEDEEFWEKYLSAFVENFALDLAPFNKLPIVSDIFEGALAMFGVGFYSSDKMSTTWLTQAVSAVDAWKDVLGGSSSTTVYNALYKTVRAVSSYYGVAFSGAMREGVALWNNTAGAYDTTLKIRQYDLSNAALGNELYDAIISGDTKQADSLKAQFVDEDGNFSPSTYSSAVRKALRENDPRIKEAAEAQIEGNPSERVRIAKLIIADGFSQDDVVAAINAEINAMTPSDSESASKKKGFYTAEDFAMEIANGDQASAAAAKEDIIQTAQSNGKDEDTAEQSFINSAKTKLKEQYVAGNLSESQTVDALKTYCQDDDDPMDDNDIYWLLKEWKYERETGSADGYGKYNDFHNAVKTGKNLKAVIADYTGHGVTAKTLASQITTYFKPLYKNMSNYERANLKGYLLNAYTILGYNRNEKSKDIDKWLKD